MMNFNQLMNMFAKRLTHRLMGWGIDTGIKRMSRGNPEKPQTPEEKAASRKQEKTMREAVKRMKQARRLTRRM